mmetsp:Transcript_62706/g.154182  ORF Transcript_62706/g.154182 Transcript_62706/m.154182 type:complete len:92 (+) Transcript_62706:321-596(+)
MDRKGVRGVAHPYDQQQFNTLLTDAHVGSFDSVEVWLLLLAGVLIFFWWRNSWGQGSFLLRHAAAHAGATSGYDAEMQEAVGINGYQRVRP